MNLLCAYCGFPFAEDRVAVLRRERTACARLTWVVFTAALVLPLVGLVAGFSYIARPDAADRAIGRLWLRAALCSSLAYIFLLTR